MRKATLFSFAAAAALHASAARITAIPRQAPTETVAPTSTQAPEPSHCATQDLTQFSDVPRPTGTLSEAFESYVDGLRKPCSSTATGSDEYYSCEALDTSQWCDFSTKAPSSVSSAYSSYASAAASWWEDKAANLTSLVVDCPQILDGVDPIEQVWLNRTSAIAVCYFLANPDNASWSSVLFPPTMTAATTATMTTGSTTATGSTTVSGMGATGTDPTTTANAVGRTESVGIWILASIGIVAVAMSSV